MRNISTCYFVPELMWKQFTARNWDLRQKNGTVFRNYEAFWYRKRDPNSTLLEFNAINKTQINDINESVFRSSEGLGWCSLTLLILWNQSTKKVNWTKTCFFSRNVSYKPFRFIKLLLHSCYQIAHVHADDIAEGLTIMVSLLIENYTVKNPAFYVVWILC